MQTMTLDVERAQVTRNTDGTITIDDPGSPLLLTVRLARRQARLVGVSVVLREPDGRLTAAALGRLPLRQITHLVAVRTSPGRFPNEEHYRQLAQPKPPGVRSWPAEHWQRVTAVYEWGRRVRWPGGGTAAVADLWGVSRKPTAERWRAVARAAAAPQT